MAPGYTSARGHVPKIYLDTLDLMQVTSRIAGPVGTRITSVVVFLVLLILACLSRICLLI